MGTLLDYNKYCGLASQRLREKEAILTKANDAISAATASCANHTEAQTVLQGIATTLQGKAHKKISSIVTSCLRGIFEDPYEFQIEFEKKRGKTEARLMFVKAGVQHEPMGAAGGGVVDVAAFAMRLAALVLAKPNQRRVLILDEPFKFLNAARRPRVRVMLEQLSNDLGVQFIIVTHAEEIEAGTVVEL